MQGSAVPARGASFRCAETSDVAGRSRDKLQFLDFVMSVWEYRDVSIKFPCSPYPSQKVFAEKVIDCLADGANGLLESPTGTGKTLALLCATLAWRDHVRWKNIKALGGDAAESRVATTVPRVVYASRTHGQLAQAMKQLRSLDSGAAAVALGSRDALCANPRVKDRPTLSEKNQTCNFLRRTKTCEFHNNLNKSEPGQLQVGQVLDIEDLVRSNAKRRLCPYYWSREVSPQAAFVFMPYNYLFDSVTRRSLGSDMMKDSIVIVDEAHNISKVCEESASVAFTMQEIALALSEVQTVIETCMKDESQDVLQEMKIDVSLEDLALLKEFLMKLEDKAMAFAKDLRQSFNPVPGSRLLDLVRECLVGLTQIPWLVTSAGKVLDVLEVSGGMTSRKSGRGLRAISETLRILTNSNYGDLCEHYNVFLSEGNSSSSSSSSASSSSAAAFNLICLHSGVALKSLIGCGVRSVILTSGTLSPLPQTASEFDVHFGVQFSGDHVIGKGQVLARVLSHGRGKERLLSTFEHRSKPEYMISLGSTIVALADRVPDGVLVFFPSYAAMSGCVAHWQSEGSVWAELNRIKTVFVEPREKANFFQTLDQFAQKVESGSGALLIAVCRGKVSEGMNFTDKMARAVFLTGIPFPNKQDPKIRLKMSHEDRMRAERRELQTGNEWYRVQAYRGVNQALGRVIRHANDYGAVFLLDARFGDKSISVSLAKWVSGVLLAKSFEECVADTAKFFKTATVSYAAPLDKPKASLGRVRCSSSDKKLSSTQGSQVKPKKFVLKKPVDISVRYKATALSTVLKDQLTKEQRLAFKKALCSYKETRNVKSFLESLQLLQSQSSLSTESLQLFKDFLYEEDVALFEECLFHNA